MTTARTERRYGPTEASRLTGLPVGVVRAWLTTRAGQASFEDLVILRVAGHLVHELGARPSAALRALDAAVARCGFPLRRPEGDVLTDGTTLFHRTRSGEDEVLCEDLGTERQLGLASIVDATTVGIEFDGGAVAARLHPVGADPRIVVDPDRGTGLPTLRGTRVTIDMVRGFYEAEGRNVARVAELYRLEPEAVEAALEFSRTRPRAA